MLLMPLLRLSALPLPRRHAADAEMILRPFFDADAAAIF